MNIRQIKALWQWQDGELDRVSILEGPKGWAVSGRNGKTAYWLWTNEVFECQWVHVVSNENGLRKEMKLHRTPQGWTDPQGVLLVRSENALDPDIACTTLTNTLAIRRLLALVLTEATLDVLHISTPDLTPRIVTQRYRQTCDGWQHETLSSGLITQLCLDNDGLVTDYPGLCTRLEVYPQ